MISLFLQGSVIDVTKGRNHNEIRLQIELVEGKKRAALAHCRPFRRDSNGRTLRRQAVRPRISNNVFDRFNEPNQANAMGMDRREDRIEQEGARSMAEPVKSL